MPLPQELHDGCWYLSGNEYDGYKVISSDETVLARMDTTTTEEDMRTIRLIIALHNEKVLYGTDPNELIKSAIKDSILLGRQLGR